jgi:hypothetical protein
MHPKGNQEGSSLLTCLTRDACSPVLGPAYSVRGRVQCWTLLTPLVGLPGSSSSSDRGDDGLGLGTQRGWLSFMYEISISSQLGQRR